MLLTLLVILFYLLFFGVLLTYFVKLRLFFEERLAVGLLIALIIFGYLTFIVSNFIGLNLTSFLISLGLLYLVGMVILTRDSFRKMKEELADFRIRLKQKSWIGLLLTILLFGAVFGFIASQLLVEKGGEYYVQPVHSYGDISLHLGIISSFSYGDNFPPTNPILSGEKISYPFLSDFITAIFVKPLGFFFNEAVASFGVMLMIINIFILSYFTLRVTKNKFAAALVLPPFLLNGGFGFIYFLSDLATSHRSFFDFIQNLPRDYTSIKEVGYWWINVVISMFLPQRAFLLGFPTSLLIIRIFWELSEEFEIRKFIFAVFLTGLLPLIHTHSLIALLPILIWLTLQIVSKNRGKIGVIFAFGTLGAVVAFILTKLYLQQVSSPLSLMGIQIGWMHLQENIPTFYLKNFGLSLIIIPAALIWGILNKLKLAALALIAQIWFILPSIIRFQPWDFDNTKLFIYWYAFSMVLVALFLTQMFKKNPWSKIFVVLVFFLIIFSGLLDNIRVLSSSGTRYQVYSKPAIKVGEFVERSTPPKAVFLAVDKFDNPAVSLAGRRTVLGFHGWVWTYGLNYSEREIDVANMLSGTADEETFKKYNVNYAIFFTDPTSYSININNFNKRYKLIYNQDGYLIYEL